MLNHEREYRYESFLAYYILMGIVVEGDTVQKLVQDLDGKEKYVSTLVSILEDVGWWIEQELR
jgi:hypothetical protein